MAQISTQEVERIIKKMDTNNKSLNDNLCPLDKSKIYTHKSHTTNFCKEYYPEHVMKKGIKKPASPTDWNMRRYRLREDLKKYLETDIDYKDISAPLKAYINWCVKERAHIKNTCMESKYNPEDVKNVLKQNKELAVARDNILKSIEEKNKKEVRDMGCQTDPVKNMEFIYAKKTIKIHLKEIKKLKRQIKLLNDIH